MASTAMKQLSQTTRWPKIATFPISFNGSLHKGVTPPTCSLSEHDYHDSSTFPRFNLITSSINMLVSTEAPPSPTDSRLPFDSLDPNHHHKHGVRLSPSSVSTIEDSPSVKTSTTTGSRRDEQHRRKLAGLHHAAFCTHMGRGPCPGHSHCLAHKRVFAHMHACLEGSKCIVPGCAKARLIWTHFSTCTATSCTICSVIPAEDRTLVAPPAKSHLPRSPKGSSAFCMNTTPTQPQRLKGRPPLSPKPPRFPEPSRSSPPGSPAIRLRPRP